MVVDLFYGCGGVLEGAQTKDHLIIRGPPCQDYCIHGLDSGYL
jgi:site-specific DNA-cytosine methylase